MRQFNDTGMSCAACSARVEKAVCKLEGVDSVSVSLLTNSMVVEGDAPSDMIVQAVEQAGYKATEKNSNTTLDMDTTSNQEEELKDTETPKLRNRFNRIHTDAPVNTR